MKKKTFVIGFVAIAVFALACCAIFLYERSRVAMIIDDEAAWDVRDSISNATQMKVVILPDGTVTRYVSEDEDSYMAELQDIFAVKKEGASVEIWSAAEGKGIVYMKTPGMVQVLYEPDPAAGVKRVLCDEEGMCPSVYVCLGFKDGWYEIDMGESGSGYVQAVYMNWDAINTF